MEDSYQQKINHSSIHMKLYEHTLDRHQSLGATDLVRTKLDIVSIMGCYGNENCLLLNLQDGEFNSCSTLPNVLSRLSDYLFTYNSGAYTNKAYLLPDIIFEKEGKQYQYDVLVVRLPDLESMRKLNIPEWVYQENLLYRLNFIASIANMNNYTTVGASITNKAVIAELQQRGIRRLIIQGGSEHGNC